MYLGIDPTELEKIIKNSDLPVVVYFSGSWCLPCRKIGPVIEDLARELEGFYRFIKIIVDDEMNSILEFKIRFIPTILFFKEGREVFRLEGIQNKENIQTVIMQHF